MSSTDVEVNPYDLLDIKLESTEQDIRTAYRQRSLKVHPDRNRNNPDAARKFHELNQAYELLLDPLRRLALDAKLRVKQARAERFKSYDTKRKNLVEELEEREQAFKKARMDRQKEEVETWRETEMIKEEGRKRRENREYELRQREEENRQHAAQAQADLDAPSLDPLDTTVRLKYALQTHPNLTTPQSIANVMSTFGPTDTDSIVLSLKPAKKTAVSKPPKYGTALVPFKQIGDAFAAVCASGAAERGLGDIQVGWIGGKEPRIVAWLKKVGKLSTPLSLGRPNSQDETRKDSTGPPHSETRSSPSPFSSFPVSLPGVQTSSLKAEVLPTGVDYESLTLMRLRQAERERLEREIREQEGDE